jgi:hypothetical protein
VLGIPNGTEVDINSTIQIGIRKDEVQIPRSLAPVEDAAALALKSAELKDALSKLSAVITAKSAALAAYERMAGIPLSDRPSSHEFTAFISSRDAADELENKFSKLPLWNPSRLAMSENAIENLFDDSTYKAVGEVLSKELAKAESTFKDAEDQAKRNTLSLRLEALLEPSKGDPAAIHLPNYDSLEQREARFKESNFLDKEDWEALKTQYTQTVALAKEAERVRKGEASLRDSIRKAGLSQFDRFMSIVDEIEPILRQDWPSLSRQVNEELNLAAKTTRDIVSKYAAQGISDLTKVTARAKELPSIASQIAGMREILGRLKGLRDEWRQVSPETLVGTIDRTKDILQTASKLIAKASEIEAVAKELTPLMQSLESKPAELSQAAWDDFRKEIIQGGGLEQTKKLVAAAKAVRELEDELQSAAKLFATKPIMSNLRVPEARDISWAEAPDTRIELPRTPRAIDDRLQLLATLKIGESDYMKSRAVFSVKQFGWHSSLAPSVILARAVRTTSSFDRDFKFAPAVGWLQTYYPRDTEQGPWNRLSRFSQVGVGLHAAFLDIDPQKDVEIGLGGALSFWHDRIIAGVGWDLMAASRPYFYIGSNLIPILQALGYGKGASAGKQP